MKKLQITSVFAAFVLLGSLFMTSCKKTTTTVDNTTNTNQQAYDNASIVNGGIMFDKFWASESTFDQADANIATFNASSDFFRCKQCHGWDGLGRSGAYISRAPKTTRPNVALVSLMEVAANDGIDDIFSEIKGAVHERRDISYDLSTYDPATNNTDGDMMPKFSQILTDAQIWDLVKFIKEGMFDVSHLYDATYAGAYPTGTATFTNIGKDGDAAKGNTFYTANCKVCHGATGLTLTLEHGQMSLGQFIRNKSNEGQHKVRFGHLGSEMTGVHDATETDIKNLYKACADVSKFPDL